MGALLRRLKLRRDEAGLPHSVTYEATHHGPFMTYPSLFVELGSDERWYDDVPSGRVLAVAIHDVLDGQGSCEGPVLVAVGGGHYVPRATDVALAGTADFGHFIPAYALEGEDGAVLERAVAATPHASGVQVHKKGLKGPERQRVMAWLAQLGLSSWSDES
jgi:D-aminoacyl-tRNA deacylase